MTVDRRHLIALSLGLGAIAAPALARARSAPRAADGSLPVWPPAERFDLWPAGELRVPPGLRPRPQVTRERADGYRNLLMRGTVRPDVGVFRPRRPDGRAVLIIPGGGYSVTSLRGEGIDVALTLAAQGITGFVLNYRLPGDGWADRADVPLSDAQRAMRLIREGATRFRIDPAKLGVLGFSAGGHLAASLATLHDLRVYRPLDAADRQSARPAFAGLMYAVSSMDPGRSHGGSRANLLGPDPDPAMQRRYAVDRHITTATPPLFLLAAEDDPTVPVTNSLDLLAAAREARVPVEAHIIERGGHGFGTRLPRINPGSLWPDLFDRWTLQTLAAVR
jgi:acetyl esterase/lipase